MREDPTPPPLPPSDEKPLCAGGGPHAGGSDEFAPIEIDKASIQAQAQPGSPPPLPPPALPPPAEEPICAGGRPQGQNVDPCDLQVSRNLVAEAMRVYAREVRKTGKYVSLFPFVVWSVMKGWRTEIHCGSGRVDVVERYAAWATDTVRQPPAPLIAIWCRVLRAEVGGPGLHHSARSPQRPGRAQWEPLGGGSVHARRG